MVDKINFIKQYNMCTYSNNLLDHSHTQDNEHEDLITAMFYQSDVPINTFIETLANVMTRLVRITSMENPELAVQLIRGIDSYPEFLIKDIAKVIPTLREKLKEGA